MQRVHRVHRVLGNFLIDQTFWFIELGGKYGPFHKTLPRPRAIVNWISVRFYDADCTIEIRTSQKKPVS